MPRLPLKEQLRLIPHYNLNWIKLSPNVDVEADNDDLEKAGSVIANMYIDSLQLVGFGEAGIAKYEPLFHRISQNESIKSISIRSSDVCEGFLLLLGKSISGLEFRNCDITHDIFASVLETKTILSSFHLFDCTFKLDEGSRSAKRAKINTVQKEITVERLFFVSTCLGKHGFEAVSRFFLDPNVTLKRIDIDNSHDKQWDISFLNGLMGCKSLEKIIYSNSGENNLILLSSVLPDLTLRELDIRQIQISSDTERALSHGILQNSTLESIILYRLETTEVEWAKMIPACLGPTSMLKTLNICRHNEITDSVILSLTESLANNSTLEELDLSGCHCDFNWLVETL